MQEVRLVRTSCERDVLAFSGLLFWGFILFSNSSFSTDGRNGTRGSSFSTVGRNGVSIRRYFLRTRRLVLLVGTGRGACRLVLLAGTRQVSVISGIVCPR